MLFHPTKVLLKVFSISFKVHSAYGEGRAVELWNIMVFFAISVPNVKIYGDRDLFVKSSSTVQLRCVISQSLVPPTYIEVCTHFDLGNISKLKHFKFNRPKKI